MIDEYKAAGIPIQDVFAQSFDLADVLYWMKTEPGLRRAGGLSGRPLREARFRSHKARELKTVNDGIEGAGVKILAPPICMMLELNEKNEIVPSDYAKAAKAAGLDLIAWSLERDGPLDKGGGFYHRSVKAAIDRDGDTLTVLDVLAKQVGIRGMFSDWPATTTFYASCMGMK